MRERAFGTYTYDDGQSRKFDDASTNPRQIVAQTLAKRAGWAEIRPEHWAEAGAIVKALRTAGRLADGRTDRTEAHQ